MSPRAPDEPVRLTKIYTRGGDKGETSLGDGSRVSKLDPLVRAYGAVDELNSIVGWAQVEARDRRLERAQNDLFDLGADLSVPYEEGDGKLRVTPAKRRSGNRAAQEGLTKPSLCRRAALSAPSLRPSRPCSWTTTGTPCVLASERPSHPDDERGSAKPS